MLDLKDKGYLLKIIEHSKRIVEITRNITKKEYDNNQGYKEMICFNILQIGELANRLSDSITEEYNSIPWKAVKSMRDRIVHDYGAIDFDIVWETSKKDIIELNKYCDDIISANS